MIRYIDVCSGISAPTMAWKPLGWKALCFAEIEPFPRAVLKHHYPEVPLHGDFTKIEGTEHGPVDLLVGGTPCQSFSVAGLRGGMADERGQLALEFLRLLDRARARWVVWENVPGVLSSNGGRDFGSFLGGLVELGYGFAYRVLDAQYAGVPQRRRRVFVVGHIGDWRRAAAVLFERHSLSGDTPPRREARASVTQSLTTRFGSSGPDLPDAEAGWLVAGQGVDFQNSAFTGDVAGTLLGEAQKRGNVGLGVAHSLRAEGFDASEDGTGRGTPLVPVYGIQSVNTPREKKQNGLGVRDDGSMYSLTARDQHAVAFTQNQRDEVREVPVAGALAAEPGMKQQTYIAFSAKDHGADAQDNLSPTLRAGGHLGSHANAGVMPAVAYREIAGALTSNYGKQPDSSDTSLGPNLAGSGSAVRRLTPRECERLQGFPDDFTLVPYRGKPAADGPRYKALGNSMAVPVVRWIGERINAVEALYSQAEAA